LPKKIAEQDNDRDERIWQAKLAHRKRLMYKSSNDESKHGLADYLDSFKFKQDDRAKE